MEAELSQRIGKRAIDLTNEQFAVEVVQCLRKAGHEALWAGGCVRDRILGKIPKDYDVATDATPSEVRQIFQSAGRKTFAIGESFGVIMVRGPRGVENIEVATFRRDLEYSDGRRPDGVEYSTAEEDAKRRDFTINGLFFDPINKQVIDYVGGEPDIERGVVRAIGDPHERFREDKLRMLRAVRFAATLDFAIEPETMSAIQSSPRDILIVSPERIGMEMRRMLIDGHRAIATKLLFESGLMATLLPESQLLQEDAQVKGLLYSTLSNFESARVSEQSFFPMSLSAIFNSLSQVSQKTGVDKDSVEKDSVEKAVSQFKMTNDERRILMWVLNHIRAIETAKQSPWPEIQRLLIQPEAESAVELARSMAAARGEPNASVEFCLGKLRLPAESLNPAPLLTGHDLTDRGLVAGKVFKTILNRVRDLQLDGVIQSKDEAWEVVDQVIREVAE